MNTAEVMPDVEELVTLEPPVVCEHSQHNDPGWQHMHSGPATHWVQDLHGCRAGYPIVYAACERFTQYVQEMRDREWLCRICHEIRMGREVFEVIGPIDG